MTVCYVDKKGDTLFLKVYRDNNDNKNENDRVYTIGWAEERAVNNALAYSCGTRPLLVCDCCHARKTCCKAHDNKQQHHAKTDNIYAYEYYLLLLHACSNMAQWTLYGCEGSPCSRSILAEVMIPWMVPTHHLDTLQLPQHVFITHSHHLIFFLRLRNSRTIARAKFMNAQWPTRKQEKNIIQCFKFTRCLI